MNVGWGNIGDNYKMAGVAIELGFGKSIQTNGLSFSKGHPGIRSSDGGWAMNSGCNVGKAGKVKNPSVMLYTCFGPRSASAMRHYPNFPTCNVDGSGVIRRDSTGNVKTYIDSKVLTDSGQYQANAMARIGYYCD